MTGENSIIRTFVIFSTFVRAIDSRSVRWINETRTGEKMGGTCGTYGGRERCAQGFGAET